MKQARLLTLTGVGGCGKTHLAIRVAADIAPRFPEGPWFIELAPVADPAQVPRSVAARLGIRGAAGQRIVDSLVGALSDRNLLLILDNCEHLVGACAQLAETLLHACPSLRILATSREPLRVAGEVVWRVPPLALPTSERPTSIESLAEIESVQLFVDRARARRPDFSLSLETADAIAEICRRMEGIPLAIELAAAQLRAMTLHQIVRELDQSLRVLGGGSRTVARHETLQATLDWSYSRLDDAERTVFHRLSVFAGGFTRRAAEQVCGDAKLAATAVWPALVNLLDKSLIEAHVQAAEARYRLLEPVRQYAWEHLVAEQEAALLQHRHAEYVLDVVEAAESELMTAQRRDALDRLEADYDNIRAVLTWSRRSGDSAELEMGMRMGAALFWFWGFRGEAAEGLAWLEPMLSHELPVPPALRARLFHAGGELAWLFGQLDDARARLEYSASLFRELGDSRGLAYDLQALATLLAGPAAEDAAQESLRLFEEVGDTWGAAHASSALWLCRAGQVGSRTALERAVAPWIALGDDWGTAQFLNFLGDFERMESDLSQAQAHYEEALRLLRACGLPGTVPSLLHNLGWVALRRGDHRQALDLFRESLVLFRNQGDERGIAECLDGVAGVLAALRQAHRAARMVGAATAQREAFGATVWRANADDVAHTLASLRRDLDESNLAAAIAEGRSLTRADAIGEALADVALPSPRRGNLTRRELEVAGLVAEGMSNRQIAERLVTSEGTARLHVKHVLRKLGFGSRAQIAAWAVVQGIATTRQ